MKTPDSTQKTGQEPFNQRVQQLSLWAQEFITGGRSPFRRIEPFAPILTPAGEIHPPLVFWINRDSYMAGGVLFFPDPSDPSPLPQGQMAAEALGLNYFVTWDISHITLWQRSQDDWSAARKLPVGGGESPNAADSHEALLGLMEAMKTFSVLGAVLPDNLSAYYLANLLRATMASLQTPLTEHYRIHRGMAESTRPESPAEKQAQGKSFTTLVRVMALALHDMLPKAGQPQKLEGDIAIAIAALPEPLASALRMLPAEAALPEEAQVRLHLLLHRLTQLDISRQPQRALQALEILRLETAAELGGHPVPGLPAPACNPVLLLHPDAIPEQAEAPILVASPPLIALHVLLRHLYRRTPFKACVFNALEVRPEPAPASICGTLTDSRLPSVGEKRELTARLRLSWPARRFRLPPRTPMWAWQLLHLVGLGAKDTFYDVVTPPHWLSSTFGKQLLGLILETAALHKLHRQENSLRLQLRKSQQAAAEVEIVHGRQVRRIAAKQLRQGAGSLLVLALTLHEDIWNMIVNGKLHPVTSQTWTDLPEAGLLLFLRTGLGRYLWQVASGGRPLPRRTALRNEVLRQSLPLPGRQILAKLQHLQAKDQSEPNASLLDRELALYLGPLPELPAVASSVTDHTEHAALPDTPEQEVIEAVCEQVFRDGTPIFPDHYLYDYYRPELRTYVFDSPLTIQGEFFGLIEVRDARGNSFQVEGLEAAQALVLVSSQRIGSVDLPVDRSITVSILDRYRQDLRKLRGSLVKEVFRRQADPHSAKAIVEKLWRQKSLPPWHLISGA